MKTINRIISKTTSSATIRWFGISRKLLNCTGKVTQREQLDESKYADNWNATLPTVKAVNRILALPGVLELVIRPYEINVEIAAVFSWDDLQAEIITILKEVYFADINVTIVNATNASLSPECINRILYKNTKSPTVRWYGVSTKLLNCTGKVNQTEPVNESEYTDNWNFTQQTASASNRLLALPGVLELIVRPYEINVSIAAVFNWDDLHESIITILKQVYFADVWVDIAEAGQE
jgi:hypothetical protein